MTTSTCLETSPLVFQQSVLTAQELLGESFDGLLIPLVFQFEGLLSVKTISSALTEIIRRHEAFRSSYSLDNSGKWLVSVAPEDISSSLAKLSIIKDVKNYEEAEEDIRQFFSQWLPTELLKGPIARFGLIQLPKKTNSEKPPVSLLLLLIHHVAFDASSHAIIIQDLQRMLNSTLSNNPPSLSPYFSFKNDPQKRSSDEWELDMQNANLALSFPRDKKEDDQGEQSVGRLQFEFPKKLTKKLKKFSGETSNSRFTVLMTAFQILLYRFNSEEQKFTVGTPVNCRFLDKNKWANSVGCFVDMAPIVAHIKPNSTFTELLESCKIALNKIRNNPDLLWTKMSGVSSSTGLQPWFRTVVQWLDFSRFDIDLNDKLKLTSRIRYDMLKTVMFDIVTNFWFMQGENVQIEVLYRAKMFSPEMIQNVFDSFIVLFDNLLASPDLSVSSVSLITSNQKILFEKVLVGPYEAANFKSVTDAFADVFSKYPDKTAISDSNGTSWTYSELQALSSALQNKIMAHIQQEENPLFVILIDRSPLLILSLISVIRAGAGYVIIDPKLPTKRQEAIIDSIPSQGILTVDKYISSPILSASSPVILVNADIPKGNFSQTIEHPNESSINYVAFTSGTTGTPKPAAISHRSVLLRFCSSNKWAKISSKDIQSCLSNISFDGFAFEWHSALLNGARLHILSDDEASSPSSYAQICQTYGITHSFLPVALFHTFAALQPDCFEGLRFISVGGEALHKKSIESLVCALGKLPELGLMNLYGPAETTVACTMHTICDIDLDCRQHRSVPIGVAMPNVEMLVVDSHGMPVPPGVPGELLVGGVSVSDGEYLGLPEINKERWIEKPSGRMYRTGDLVQISLTGVLLFLGRMDRQIKIRSFRVELGEIEHAIAEFPGVIQSVVSSQGNTLIGFVVTNSNIKPEDVLLYLQTKLPQQLMPANLIMIESIPLTVNGKVDYKALPWPEKDRLNLSPTSENDDAKLEQILTEIECTALGISSIPRDANFFSLGGDSINAIVVASRAKKAGINVLSSDILKYPTLKSLVQFIHTSNSITQPVHQSENTHFNEQHQRYFTPTPVQQWCLSLGWSKINCFSQALLIKLPTSTSLAKVQKAFSTVISAHQGLNVGYSDDHNAFYVNTAKTTDRLVELTVSNFASIAEHAQALTSKLDMVQGPLINGALINAPQGKQAVLLCASHLVIDVLSWYLIKTNLLEALDGVTLQSSKNTWLELAKQLTFPSVIDYFVSSESSYWEAVDPIKWERAATIPIPSQAPHCSDTQYSKIISQSHVFDIQGASKIFETALSALGLALCDDDLFHKGLLVSVENNGRHSGCPLIAGDFSETVGWFTSVYPLMIGGAGGDATGLVESVKELVTKAPHKGFGYGILRYNTRGRIHKKLAALPEPQISFNFFGKASDSLSLNLSPEFTDNHDCLNQLFIPARPTGKRPYLIEVVCKHNGNQIEISLDYSSTMFEDSVMQQIIQRFFMNFDRLCKTGTSTAAYPVTSMQEGMIFHSQTEPQSLVYRCQAIYSIFSRMPVDFEKLQRAWRATISAHDVVTNKFYWTSGMLMQEPQIPYNLPWKVVNSRDDFYKKAEQSLREIDILKGKTFDIIIDTSSKLMAVTFHHAILDGWSLALILKRLVDEYLQNVCNSDETQPKYGEYVKWLNEKSVGLQKSTEEFWRTELLGVQPTLITPLLSPQPHESVIPISKGRLTERQNFSRRLSGAIGDCAKTLCVSPFVIFHVAWLSVLSKFLGTPNIVVGITTSGRMYSDFPEVESLAGLLINTVPHSISVDCAEKMMSLIQRTHAKLQEIFVHSHISLSALNSLCGLSRGEQLFDSIIVFENYPMPAQDAAFSFALQTVSEQTNFPLSLCVDVGGVSLHYNGEKIGGCSARLILRCFLQALEQIACNQGSSKHVGDIRLVTEIEYDLLVLNKNVNVKNVQGTEHQTLCSLVEEQAVLSPNSIAVLDNGESYTYKQIVVQARNIADSLSLVFSEQDSSRFVAICIKRSPWLVASMLGVHMAGGAFVLVDQSLPSERIANMLSDIQCCAVLACDGTSLALQSYDYPLIIVDTLIECVTAPVTIPSLDVSHVVYTSGSSGKPKGVLITHKNMVSRLASKTNNLEPAWLNIGPGDVVANLCSPSFDVYFSEVFHCLIHGAALAIIPEKTVLSPRDTAKAFNEMGVTHVFMPTALFHALAATCPEIFIPLKHIHVGGEVLQLPLLRKVIEICGNRLPPLGFVNGYGPTEATIGSHRYIIRDLKQVETLSSIPIGHPCPQTLQYIVDSNGDLAPIGMIGELLLGGDCVSPGYIGQAELTAQKFTINPFSQKGNADDTLLYHTGDMARWTETGDIEFFGRKDRQVKVRGYRIELEEVEAALLSCDGVVAAAAIISNTHALIAFVVTHSEKQINYTDLVSELQKLLPQYMIPTKFAVVDSIPTTTNGKVDKKALVNNESLATFLSSTSTDTEAGNLTPETPLSVSLAEIWANVLGTDDIKNNSNFFELGGDSILAMRAARYAEEREINVSVHDIFDHPILSDLVEVVSTKERIPTTPPVESALFQAPSISQHARDLCAGMVSLAVAVPGKLFREDKLSELVTYLNNCSFKSEYVSHISETGKCPGDLLDNDWYTKQPWFAKWLDTVPKIKGDPFDGLETRARYPFDPVSLRETCHPFPMLCSDASTLAGAAAIVYAGINPLDIDGLIDCAMPQDDHSDTNYLKVHKNLGLDNATPLSLFTACTSFIAAIEAATAYVRAGHRKCVLVCATQVGSHISDPTSSVGCKLADGAVAAIISKVQPGQGYQGSHGSALGEFCGAMDLSLKPPHMHLESPKAQNLCNYLHPGNMELYDQTFGASVKEMVAVCRQALQKSGVTDNSKVFFAPHQPNSELPMLWARELGIKKMYFSWKEYGSMGPVCPAVNLFQAIEEGKLSPGEIALLAAPGISMNYYALVEVITEELVRTVTGK